MMHRTSRPVCSLLAHGVVALMSVTGCAPGGIDELASPSARSQDTAPEGVAPTSGTNPTSTRRPNGGPASGAGEAGGAPSREIDRSAPPTAAAACDVSDATQSCGVGACRVTVSRCLDGRAVVCVPAANNAVPEGCDGVDDNCDGVVDNAYGSMVTGTVCSNSSTGCVPPLAVALTPGARELRVEMREPTACPSVLSASSARDAYQTVLLTLTTRSAVALSSADAHLDLIARDGGVTRVVLGTTADLCARGTNTGVAVLAPGTYELRPNAGSAPVNVRAVTLPVPDGTPDVIMPGQSRVTFNTASTSDDAPECRDRHGVTARVLLCPAARFHNAVLSADLGAVVALQSSPTDRTCYPVSARADHAAALPSGDLVMLHAWPLGSEGGIAAVTLR